MVVVLVAGGLGDVGRTITQAIHQTGKHRMYVMTRKIKQLDIAEVLEDDYSSVERLTEKLQRLKIDIVISALNLQWPGAPDAQTNLIRAAGGSDCVKGFIPSEFNIDYAVPESKMPYPFRHEFLAAVEELKQWPKMHYTLIRCGFFLDYLGLPYAETNLHHMYCLLDFNNSKAVIPGDGNAQVVFTHSRDVAKFTAALLDLSTEKWPVESTVVGGRMKLNSLVTSAQKIAGHKFEISYDAVDALRLHQTTELPSNISFYQDFPGGKEEFNMVISTMMIGMAEDVFDIQGTSLNAMFPGLDAISVEPFLQDCFSKTKRSEQ